MRTKTKPRLMNRQEVMDFLGLTDWAMRQLLARDVFTKISTSGNVGSRYRGRFLRNEIEAYGVGGEEAVRKLRESQNT